jgi:hypothetical protein
LRGGGGGNGGGYIEVRPHGVNKGAFIEAIVQVARTYNATKSISGLLIYNAGHFMQFLEGPQEPTLTCYERVRADRRHHTVHRFFEGYADQRCFPAWSMAFRNFESYEPFLRSKFEECVFGVTRADIVYTRESSLEIMRMFAQSW